MLNWAAPIPAMSRHVCICPWYYHLQSGDNYHKSILRREYYPLLSRRFSVKLANNIPMCCLGETSKFNFCGPRFQHSLTQTNIIVCDFCRRLIELSGLSIYIVVYSNLHHSQMVVIAFCDMSLESHKQLTNISLKQFVALSGEF